MKLGLGSENKDTEHLFLGSADTTDSDQELSFMELKGAPEAQANPKAKTEWPILQVKPQID